MEIVSELNNSSSIPDAFFKIARSMPDTVVYTQAVLDKSEENQKAEDCPRKYIKRDYAEVSSRVKKLASFLISSGFKPGHRAAIISNSRCEWLEADLAILTAGGACVSVYQSLLAHDIAYILHDSECKFIFAENEEQVKKLADIKEKKFTIPEIEGRPATIAKIEVIKVITFEKVSSEDTVYYDDIINSGNLGEEFALTALKREDLASLVYTSGTTGPAKGVIQTHGNHLSNIRQAFQAGMYHEKSSLLIVLPLAHSFAKLMGYICFLTPAEAIFPAVVDKKTSKLSPDSLTKDISICGASIFPLVPRMLEKMKEGIEKTASKKTLLGFFLGKALKSKSIIYKPLKNLIKKKLFGSNFANVVSGGAKLSPIVAQFFEDLGIVVLEGYGLTETCVATNVNRHGKVKIGTVGPVLAPDIELTLSEEGEILFRGPNISKGYLNRPEATKAAWDSEGRFHTGDLGSIDNDGYLSITGRKKELIVTAGGKKVAPEGIENRIKAIRFVSQAVLVGEGKPCCAALITVNFHEAKKAIAGEGVVSEEETWLNLHDKIWLEIQKLNDSLASFETIKKIELLREDFTIENGFLTPTLKVKRNEVTKKFKDIIEELYKGSH